MKDTFFDQKTIDNNRHLAQLFFGYTHYCNEIFWLLKQRVFAKLCTSLGYIKDHQLQEGLATQKRAFDSGKQLHIGEVLLQMYLLDEKQVYQICSVLGESIAYCEKTKQHYKTFFSTEEEKQRHSDGMRLLAEKDIDKDLLLRFLRMSFRWPREVPKNTNESHDLFVFLNMETHAHMQITSLDNEFHNVLNTFEHWVKAPIMLDKKVSSVAELSPAEKKKNLELVKQVFLGYTKNLRELLWLLQQKMFEVLATKYYKITERQIEDALKVQHRAFQQNKQMQLPEIMLHMYLLDEKQVLDILRGLGHKLFYDASKETYYLSSDSYINPDALNCKASLEEATPRYEVIMQAMRIDLAKPMPIPTALVTHKSFVFFRKRGLYKPSFTLSLEEVKTAVSSFYQFLELEAPEDANTNDNDLESENSNKEIVIANFSETHNASDTLNSRMDLIAETMNSDADLIAMTSNLDLTAIPLGEDSIIEFEKATASQTQNSLAKRLRKTMALPSMKTENEKITIRPNEKKVTALLQKFSKTITSTLQRQSRRRENSPTKAVPATRKPVDYSKYSETVYDYVLAKIDAEEKGVPSQKEIMGKRTNVFEQMARKISDPQNLPKKEKKESNFYDEILNEIETDQKKGSKELAEKRAVQKEKVQKELEEELEENKKEFSGYYIDFQSGEQLPPDMNDLEAEEVDEQNYMDISTEVDSFLQSFDSIDESTEIEKLYDKYGVDMGKDPLLEIEENTIDIGKKQEEVKKNSPLERLSSRDNLRRTVSISQPKLQNAIPTQLEYIGGYSTTSKKPGKFTIFALPLLLILFTAGLVYLFVQPYLVKETTENISENTNPPNDNKVKTNVDNKIPDEYFVDIPVNKQNENNTNTQKEPEIKDKNTQSNTQNNTTNNNTKNNTSKLAKNLQGNEQDPDRVAKSLRDLSQRGELGVKDIAMIKELHSRYANDKKVKNLCIWAMGSIKEPEARRWLEDILITSVNKEDQKASLDALEKIGDKDAKNTILQSFQREQEFSLLEAAAYSLGKIAPNDERIQQVIISKFYQLTDENLKRRMINALSSMRIESQNSFFVRVAIDAQYSTGIRLEALDALMINSAGNGNQFIPEVTSLSASQDEELKEKALEVLEFLAGGN